MNVHLGEVIQKAVKEKKFPITVLAQRLHKSRQHVYNMFQNPNVPLEEVMKIGRIIQHDFTVELRAFAVILEEYVLHKLSEPEIKMETVMYWKSKYFELLEDHKLLLKKELKTYVERRID